MKRYLRLFFILSIIEFVCSDIATAQFGIGGRYSTIQDGYWHDVLAFRNSDLQDQIASVYALYWFRLKQKRIEFLPELGYYKSIKTNTKTGPPNELSGFYAQLNVDVYFLDLGDDCNCPTFSKQGDLLKRGLFAEFSTGVEFRRFGIDYSATGEWSTRTFKRTVPKFYAGLGFDIGLSDLITVTPAIGASLLVSTAWDGVEEFLEVDSGSLDSVGRNRDVLMTAGVRILFRPDYLRRRK